MELLLPFALAATLIGLPAASVPSEQGQRQ